MKTLLLMVCVVVLASVLLFALSSSQSNTILINPIAEIPKASVPPEDLLSPTSVSLLFGGDMMFDRSIRENISKKGGDFVLLPLHKLLLSQDLVIANLEGPITPNDSTSVGSVLGSKENYIFTFPLTTTNILKAEHIGIVNLGNNHSDDFGRDGIAQTIGYLDESSIKHFGDVRDETKPRYLIQSIKGIRIGFVNYNQFVSSGLAHAIEDISVIRPQVDVLIMYTHWGTEYVPEASSRIQAIAHTLVDAGADLIIGSHPHVIQQKEEYRGKWIYYSLGNMIFDQYVEKETQAGLLVEVHIDIKTKALTCMDIPIRLLKTGQTTTEN